MRDARRTWLAAALALPVASGALAACSAPSIPADDLGAALPERSETSPLDGGANDAARARTAEAGAERTDTPDAGADGAADADASASQAVLCTVPDLVLCFGFEGAVVDGSPNALVPVTSGVTFVPGKHGRAASFDATSAMRFGASSAFEVSSGTIEAWVKPASGRTSDGVIFDADDRASLTILEDGAVYCKPGGAKSGTKLVPEQWSHVACVFDNADGDVFLYVNGVQVDREGGRIGSASAAGAAIGGNAPSGEPFVGLIDSLRVFRVARTPAQIAAAAAP